MGMSIDEVIKELTSLIDCGILPISYEKYGKPFVTKESIEVAIETMRKYQKIRDKISTIYVGYRHGYEVMADVMEILREVEDGKID